MKRTFALVAVLSLAACGFAKASPVATSVTAAASVAAMRSTADVALQASPPAAVKLPSAFQAVQKAAPVVMAVAGEALASAPAVAVAAATGGPLAGVWAFVTNNPRLVELVGGLLVVAVVWLLVKRGVITPTRAAQITSVTIPVAQSPQVRQFVRDTPTKADDGFLAVLDKVNEELAKVGAAAIKKPAEIELAKQLLQQHAQAEA